MYIHHLRIKVMTQRMVFMRNYSTFNQFLKYHKKIPLGYFNAKVQRENIFKPTIKNESLHEVTNDNGVRVVNHAMSKNLSRVQCSHTTIFIKTLVLLLMGKHTIRLTISY
jgi:hypothetical protein